MKPFLIFLLALAPVCLSFDLSTYKNDYQVQVGIPYKNAVTVAASNIIEYLAITDVPKNANDGKKISSNLNIQAQTFSNNLGAASESSDGLRVQLDHEVENLVAQGSAVEKQIADTEGQLKSLEGKITEANAQVVEAQNQAAAAQKSIQDAEHALSQEEDRVHDAEQCLPGWLGKQICKVVNHDGIRHAESARDNARNDLNGRQQRLGQYQGNLNQLKQQQANLQQTKTNYETNKTQLTDHLGQLNLARNSVNNVDIQLKAVIEHITTLFGKSQVLVDVVKSLIDMETVIKPLTAIADQIIGFTPNQADVDYLNAMKQKISVNLPLVQAKLAQYALIPPM